MNEPSTYFIRREIPEPEYIELANSAVENEPNATDYWRAVVRHARLIFTLVAISLLCAGVVVHLWPQSYIATCTILIDHRAPKADLKPTAETEAISDEEA